MNKLAYNLARTPQVDRLHFALRAALLFLLALLLGILAVANLANQREIDRRSGGAKGLIEGRIERLRGKSALLQREINAWKQAWSGELAAANHLIELKGFSFISRFDRLEEAFHPGVRLLHVILSNERSGRIKMTVSAQSLQDLFALYRNLAPYDLVISNETQSQNGYLVNLNIRLDHE